MKQKINKISNGEGAIKETGLYDSLRDKIDYFLNYDRGGVENRHPIMDGANPLLSMLDEPMDSFRYLIGYCGIGKSHDIHTYFTVKNSEPKILSEHHAVILLCDYYNYSAPPIENSELGFSTIRKMLAKRIAALAKLIEEQNPELKSWFRSQEGQKDFHDFISRTNPQALENEEDVAAEDYNRRLEIAKNEEYFIFAASKLKYLFSNERYDCKIDRILIIVDNIEVQNAEFQNQLVLQYLRLCSCLKNYPSQWTGKRTFIKLLISVQPVTYNRLQQIPAISTHGSKEIYKSEQLELLPYFRWVKKNIPEDTRQADIEKWKKAENVILNLCEKFDRKYANMILGLVNMDIRRAMRVIEDILSNPVWITREARTDGESGVKEGYVFNNISVIRSLACGRKTVYENRDDQLIPNILYNTILEDNSILSLYVIEYFIKQNAGYIKYGYKPVVYHELLSDFKEVFGTRNGLIARLERTVEYLYSKGILSFSILDQRHDECTTLESGSKLYLSAKGSTIFKMLEGDSVLTEMFREDYYREADPSDPNRFCSSYELMQRDDQESLFCELYLMLREMLEHEERPLLRAVQNKQTADMYTRLFGNATMVAHLKAGVDRSAEFSGKCNDKNVAKAKADLEWGIGEVRVH